MVYQQDVLGVRGKDEGGVGDVAWGVLRAGKGGWGGIEKEGDEFKAFESLTIGEVKEGLSERFDSGGIEHKEKARS